MTRLILLLWLWTAAAWAGEPPASLKLSQARAAMPELVAYVDVRDAHGNPVGELRPEQFRATLGDKAAKVEQAEPFAKAGEGVAYMFLVDVSKSVKPDFFARIRAALDDWIDALGESDRMAVLSFGDRVEQVADFTADRAALKAGVEALKPADSHTALHQGLLRAMQLGRRADPGLPGRRVIVVLSDGLDDLFGGPTREEVSRDMQADRVPLYAIGLDKPPVTGKRKEGIDALGRFARESGGDYVSSADRPIGEVYAELRGRIKEVFRVRLSCADCKADGSEQRLQITLQADGMALTEGLNLRVLPPPPPFRPVFDTEPSVPLWAYLGGGAALLILAGGWMAVQRRNKPAPPLEPDSGEEPEPPLPPDPSARKGAAPPPVAERCQVRLVELRGANRGKDYRLEFSGEAVIGRAEDCQVAIPDDSEISSRHCALVKKERAVFLRDLGSTNGTLVNGVPIAGDYPLQPEDVIGVGRTELRVLLRGQRI
jgi:VWFA-related protein